MKKVLKFVIIILVIYLFISSLYIFIHIDFDNGPKIDGASIDEIRTVGPGFSESKNRTRIFMGLPETNSTYEGVPPIYLFSVAIRLIIGSILCIFLHKKNKKTNI